MSSSYKRTNGFSWPPDKAQLLAWLLILYFTISVFGCFCISLVQPWSIIFSILFAIMFLIHTGLNLTCMFSNPGEEATLKKKIVPQSTFDREKHKHVIENQFCNICQIVVSLKAKHCRQCNKCVTDFDHHCVYLNNCIGSRNYKIFILTIVSAFVGSLSIFIIGLAEFVSSFFNNQYFLTNAYFKEKNSTLCSPTYCLDDYKAYPIFAPVSLTGWRIYVIITTILALIASFLIGYLISYHIFLKINKMSTYEHTVKLKQDSDLKKAKLKQKAEVSTQASKLSSNIAFQNDEEKYQLSNLDLKNISLNKPESKREIDHLTKTAIKNQSFENDNSIFVYNKIEKEQADTYVPNLKLFNPRTSQNNLPCINNSDINNNNYFLVNDTLDTSVSNSNRSSENLKFNYKSNIVKLPPLSPILKQKKYDDDDSNVIIPNLNKY